MSTLDETSDPFREGRFLPSARQIRIETVAVHTGHEPDSASGAVTPPINLSTTFERDKDGTYPRGYFYSSKGNPNRAAVEECLAALEGGDTAVAFASGCAAITCVLRTLRPQDHVIVPNDMFQGTVRILREMLGSGGIDHTAVEMSDLASVRAAVQSNTKMIWAETLSNPMLKICDITAISVIAREIGALCICDNSFVTPIFQQPLNAGADLVIHATTKYLGGHGDIIGGVVIGRQNSKAIEKIRQLQLLEGAVPSPFDCWLLLRGLRTLPHRMRIHAANAMRVARFLEKHPMVEAVYYPGLESNPQHKIAKRLLKMFGGMISIRVNGGKRAAITVAANVRIFIRATSFGGTESLIEHRSSSPIQGIHTGTPDNLLRLSIGLEHADDLIDDLAQALETARSEQKEK
jgi:cystathionine gamma-synthase